MDSEHLEYNVIVVKWGNKFTSEHVNRLYRMAKRNITLPFNFYCYTEDPTGICNEVKIVPLEESLGLEKWWWKLTLFKRNSLGNGINIFLDLDVIIQNNIDHFFEKVKHDKIIIIDYNETAIAFNNRDNYTQPHYNSSIMIWYNNENCDVYEKFIKNKILYVKTYLGIDRFFSYEIPQSKFHSLDYNDYYHRNNINLDQSTEESYDLRLTRRTRQYSKPGRTTIFYNPNRAICVFNGCHENVFYQGMEKYLI
jgi:hypothetical protein